MPTIYPLTSITPGTDFLTISASPVAITTASSSGSIKINTLMVTNVTGSAATVTVDVYRSSTAYVIVNALSIPTAAVAVVIGKDSPIYLKASDALRLTSGTASAIKAVCSYEIIE